MTSSMSALGRTMAIRPGEGRSVALVAGTFAAVEAGRGLGEVGVDTLVLSRAGAAILPALYIGPGARGPGSDALWAQRQARLSYQVLNEYYVGLTRKLDPVSIARPLRRTYGT